jgi:hypothetical protein
MMICDSEGVPNVVQKIEYVYENFTVKVTYFDGQTRWLEPADEVGITDKELTEVQLLACEREAEMRWAPKC